MITLDQFKIHAKIDESNEDEYLTLLLDAAKQAVEKHINQPLELASPTREIPAPLQMAVLLIAANLYNNREPVGYANAVTVPYNYNYLVQPYIKYRSADESGVT